MARLGFTFLLGFSWVFVQAQEFSPERITNWDKAGTTTDIQAPLNQVLITDFGGDNTGATSSNTAYNSAKASFSGLPGTIVFPTGEYFFDDPIAIPNGVFLKGESVETKLTFDLGGSGHLIQMTGSLSSAQHALELGAIKGGYEIVLTDASDYQVGDIVKLGMYDEDHMTSTWAYGTLGQLIEITDIIENTLILADPLTHNYPLSRNPYVRKQNPIKNAGIECLTIEREDATSSQTSNIYIQNAFNCVVRNVASSSCNFGHVDIRTSSHVNVEGSYFHHAHGYGGGGKGYGTVLHSSSSFCLIQNNIFEHLRHSMLLQSGANGNVLGYNYSTDPYWEDGWLPTNSAGDAVLHGNYTYLNLFEGNTVQHIVVDASHGSNGPYNTFFRNRAELYGFFSDSSTPTDSLNVVGNEISNNLGFPFGNFILSGNGYYSFGNNHSGAITPLGTFQLSLNSLYLDENNLPEFLASEELPMVAYPLEMNEKLLPAELRFDDDSHVNCDAFVVTSTPSEPKNNTSLQLIDGNLQTDASLLPALVEIYSMDGRLLQAEQVSDPEFRLNRDFSKGIYVIRATGINGKSASLKVGFDW